MNRMADRLTQADENQKRFFQNVSHELRNPLMSISGYAQGIEQGVFSSPGEAAHTILTESIRLTQVVTGLLTLSHLESDRLNTVNEPVQLIDVIEDCVYRAEGMAVQKNVKITAESFDQGTAVYVSEGMLAKVLDNLLSNAVRYAAFTVTVSVRLEDNKVLVSVSDDGNGISPEDMPHIFDRCYKGRDGNFGVGLAIAHSAAERMNGRLYAENRPEGGAVFTLRVSRAVI